MKRITLIIILSVCLFSCIPILTKAPDETPGITCEDCRREGGEVTMVIISRDYFKFFCDMNGILIQIKGGVTRDDSLRFGYANGEN